MKRHCLRILLPALCVGAIAVCSIFAVNSPDSFQLQVAKGALMLGVADRWGAQVIMDELAGPPAMYICNYKGPIPYRVLHPEPDDRDWVARASVVRWLVAIEK